MRKNEDQSDVIAKNIFFTVCALSKVSKKFHIKIPKFLVFAILAFTYNELIEETNKELQHSTKPTGSQNIMIGGYRSLFTYGPMAHYVQFSAKSNRYQEEKPISYFLEQDNFFKKSLIDIAINNENFILIWYLSKIEKINLLEKDEQGFSPLHKAFLKKESAVFLMKNENGYLRQPLLKYSRPDIYLYQDKKGYFYCLDDGKKSKRIDCNEISHYLENEENVKKAFAEVNFDQPYRDPKQCENAIVCNVVLEVASKNGHGVKSRASSRMLSYLLKSTDFSIENEKDFQFFNTFYQYKLLDKKTLQFLQKTDENGQTIFHRYALKNNYFVLDSVLTSLVLMFEKNKDLTELSNAIKFLLNVKDKKNNTVLFYTLQNDFACAKPRNSLERTKNLLFLGSDPKANIEGDLILEVLKNLKIDEESKEVIVKMLIESGAPLLDTRKQKDDIIRGVNYFSVSFFTYLKVLESLERENINEILDLFDLGKRITVYTYLKEIPKEVSGIVYKCHGGKAKTSEEIPLLYYVFANKILMNDNLQLLVKKLESNADLKCFEFYDQQGLTPLHYACQEIGYISSVHFFNLLQLFDQSHRGLFIWKDKQGNTVLDCFDATLNKVVITKEQKKIIENNRNLLIALASGKKFSLTENSEQLNNNNIFINSLQMSNVSKVMEQDERNNILKIIGWQGDIKDLLLCKFGELKLVECQKNEEAPVGFNKNYYAIELQEDGSGILCWLEDNKPQYKDLTSKQVDEANLKELLGEKRRRVVEAGSREIAEVSQPSDPINIYVRKVTEEEFKLLSTYKDRRNPNTVYYVLSDKGARYLTTKTNQPLQIGSTTLQRGNNMSEIIAYTARNNHCLDVGQNDPIETVSQTTNPIVSVVEVVDLAELRELLKNKQDLKENTVYYYPDQENSTTYYITAKTNKIHQISNSDNIPDAIAYHAKSLSQLNLGKDAPMKIEEVNIRSNCLIM